MDLDPPGRARPDLGNPGIHLAKVPPLGEASFLAPSFERRATSKFVGGASFLAPSFERRRTSKIGGWTF